MIQFDGCRFADLFAGSGAVGLEAASRGATAVLLVESDPKAARTVRDNIAALGLGGTCRLVTAKVSAALRATSDHPYDVVFADPPYGTDDGEVNSVLAALVATGWLAPAAVVVIERSSRSPEPAWPEGIRSERGRRYGETTLWYGRRA
jgi:16S rRNA (guanine(966)-N(2))-methyltransferase RsmD